MPKRVADVRLLAVAGGAYVLLAGWRIVSLMAADVPARKAIPNHLLVALLGLSLIYGSYRVSDDDMLPDLEPRVLGWSIGGFALLVSIFLIIELSTPSTIQSPVFAGLLAMSLGTAGGFAIGVHEARALRLARAAEQKRAEQAELIAELERQNDRLEEFASIVSHDLRNPLNVASGRLELARNECDSEHLDHVSEAHDRMNQLIEDSLAYAREGQVVEEFQPVQLSDLAPECWTSMSDASASLEIEADGTVQADRRRLARVFDNLFRNAGEHGGDAVSVSVGMLDDGDGFYVEDDGPGIPEDDRDEVFDRGFTTSDQGSGYGLAIVKQIAEAHGWDVSVTESDAGGARFEFSTDGA